MRTNVIFIYSHFKAEVYLPIMHLYIDTIARYSSRGVVANAQDSERAG